MLKILLMSLAVAATSAFFCAPDVVAAELRYAPQISNERGIKITVILQSIRNDAKTWDVEVTLETHTQSLSDDLAKSAVLIADGKQYTPLSWEGAPPGGHHRKGKLHFKVIVPQPRSMELQIRLTGDTAPRSFQWLEVRS
jgi:hypothetical protein